MDWPVHKIFAARAIYSGELAAQYADSQVKGIVPRLERLVKTSSPQPGTPLGEMLAVAARQCAAVGGRCLLYVFTDGGWADRLLRVRDGVTATEQRRYVAAYAPRLRGLAGRRCISSASVSGRTSVRPGSTTLSGSQRHSSKRRVVRSSLGTSACQPHPRHRR